MPSSLMMNRNATMTVRALVSEDAKLTLAAASWSGTTRMNTLARIVNNGFPGGWGFPSMLEAPINSPQSQKVTVGAMVTRYTPNDTANTARVMTIFNCLSFSILLVPLIGIGKGLGDGVQDAVHEPAGFAGGIFLGDVHRLVDGHAQGDIREEHQLGHGAADDQFVHDGDALQIPIDRCLREFFVQPVLMLQHLAGEQGAVFLGVPGKFRIGGQAGQRFGEGFLAHLDRVKQLHRELAAPAAGYHFNWSQRLAISMAARVTSQPLFPPLVPALSRACSRLSVVSTPYSTGMPDCMATSATPRVAVATTSSKWGAAPRISAP